jgi:hypothetical protein
MRKFLLFCFIAFLAFVAFVHFQDQQNESTRPGSSEVQVDRYPANLESTDSGTSGTAVIARGSGAAPGAIVCADYNTVELMFHLYSHSWEEHMQAALTRGQSELINGKAAPAPDVGEYGCILLPPGTPMRQQSGNVVPVVTVKMADGNTIKGVTLGVMIASQAQTAAISAAADFQRSLQESKADFQKQLGALKMPAPNLRWYSNADRLMLVIPYGPCAILRRGDLGYLVKDLTSPNTFGPFPSREEAERSAEEMCSSTFKVMHADPHMRMGIDSPTVREIWFPPDAEPSTVPSGSGANQKNFTSEPSSIAPASGVNADPNAPPSPGESVH